MKLCLNEKQSQLRLDQSWKKCFDSLVTWEEAKKLAAKCVIFDTLKPLKNAWFLIFLALKLIFSTVPSKIRVIFSRYIKQISFCRFFYKYDNILQWFQNFLFKKGAKYRGLPKTLCKQNLSLVTRLQGYTTFSFSGYDIDLYTDWDTSINICPYRTLRFSMQSLG